MAERVFRFFAQLGKSAIKSIGNEKRIVAEAFTTARSVCNPTLNRAIEMGEFPACFGHHHGASETRGS